MVKRIIAILLISIIYSCASTQKGDDRKKTIKYRVVANKINGEKIISKTQ